MIENVEKFIGELTESLRSKTFVKLSLGNYKGTDTQLQKIAIRVVDTKKGSRLYFLYRGGTRDTAKNFDLDLGVGLVAEAFDNGFRSGHLFTTERDFQLEIGNKGKSRVNSGKPTFNTVPSSGHDREKKTQVDAASFYLKALGITDDNGHVRDKQQDKWRQINKFVEILASLVDKSALKDRHKLSIVDMGSGKGYLTFAAFDYFRNIREIDVKITGVDTKPELIALCNGIAKTSEFDGLHFAEGSIADYEIGDVDILIALHACDTATDDAIFKGIAANAELIVAAPCCHQEIRPQIVPPAMFRDILKHGVMLERTAETITDGLRSLLLERSGYATKLFEFIPTEHTPKNNMLVGMRLANPIATDQFDRQINEIKTLYGIREHHLEKLLKSKNETTNGHE